MTPTTGVDGYAFFAAKVREVLGLDLSQYRPAQMRRRLENFRLRHGADFSALGRRLAADTGFAAEVQNFLTINVSEFFRNPEHFERVRTGVLPQLDPTAARVWSAGCSIGAEAYTLAILACEAGLGNVSIWATDIDPGALERTRAGIYRPQEIAGVSPARLRRFFHPAEDGRHAVRPELREMVHVQRHDLLRDRYPIGWDLIMCRNVVIYFTDEAQSALYRRFRDALRSGGFLFVGGTESVHGAEELGLRAVAPFVYRKTD